VVSEQFLKDLSSLVPLYPFYVPRIEKLLEAFRDACPDVPLFAFFETSFFAGLSDEEKYYALPLGYLQDHHIARTGFHGIFHEFNASLFCEHAKTVSIVLDTQTTVASIYQDKPCSVSLGYTPLEGIMGKKTSGDIDPGIVFYLMKRYGLSMTKIDDMLKRQSGFVGLTGYDIPLDELFSLYGKDEKVTRAFDIYQNQILKYIGEGIAAMGGVDALVFSGSYVRTFVPLVHALIKKISFLGCNARALPWGLDQEITAITSSASAIKAYINTIPLERIIFYRTQEYCKACSSPQPLVL
jgi:acetate kinase